MPATKNQPEDKASGVPKKQVSKPRTRPVALRLCLDDTALQTASQIYAGTLHQVDAGTYTESFLVSAGTSNRLLVRDADSFVRQMQKATDYFVGQQEGDAISVTGTQFSVGSSVRILF